MKKVLFIANARYTITNFRSELVQDIKQLGHELKIVCPTGIDLDGTLVSKENILPIFLNRSGIHPIHDLKTVFDLYRIFKKEQPDVVVNFTIKPVIYASIVARLASKAKVYSNITGLGYVFTDRSFKARALIKIVTFLYRIALRCNHSVFFQNPDDLKLFKNLGLIRENQGILINGSGINLDRKLYEKVYRKKLQSFIFVGRLLKDKGLLELIEALKIVKIKFPNVLCTIIGEADKNPNSFTQEQLNLWKQQGLADFVGRINDVMPFLKEADVMVLPSYREGTPRSVLEAMVCGLPIITTDTAGCRETVVDGENGFLVPVKDHKILAQKMIYFLEHPEQIEIMGKRSLQLVAEKFDVKKVNAKILSIVELNSNQSLVDNL
ncbi:MAG: glycosyltransferase family 4 protein [Pseudobdellovibrionaceae bacterium]